VGKNKHTYSLNI